MTSVLTQHLHMKLRGRQAMVGFDLSRGPTLHRRRTDRQFGAGPRRVGCPPRPLSACAVRVAEWKSIKARVGISSAARQGAATERTGSGSSGRLRRSSMECAACRYRHTHWYTHTHTLPLLLSDGLSLEHEGQLGGCEQCADSTTRILLGAKICGQICLWLTTTSTCFQLWKWNISEKI